MRLPDISGYEYEDLLGEDPYGWSFVSTYQGNERRVIKVLKSQATNTGFVEQHLSMFSEAGSAFEGSVPMYDYVAETADSLAAFTMPFYGWIGTSDQAWQLTSLKRLLHLITGDQALDVVAELAQSLANAHAQGTFHGGLRSSGIFLTGDSEGSHQVLIGDFGQAFIGGLQFLEAGDLLFYTSPEQLGSGDFSGEMGFKWDVYAFGVIAFQILTGHLPRLDRLRQQCLKHPEAINEAAAISYGALTPVSEHFLDQLEKEKPVEWPDEAEDQKIGDLRSIVESCLEFESSDRPGSMVEIAAAISSVWRHDSAVETSSAVTPDDATAPLAVAKNDRGAVAEDSDRKPDVVEAATTPALIGDELSDADATPSSVDEETEDVVRDSGIEEKKWPLNVISGAFRGRPALKWKIASVALLVCLLVSCVFLIIYKLEAKKKGFEFNSMASSMQVNVEKQASVYLQALQEKDINSEQLNSELGQIENSHSRLLGEAKLARQILRQTQENGDEFFKLVLENRDTDVPGFREQRADALLEARMHYERLVEVYGDAPDFIVSTANALFYLGRIYKEMGEFGKALASFGEAERRYVALLEDSGTAKVDFVKNLAISKRALGLLSIKNGNYAIARHYFTESSRYWTEARAAKPDEVLNAGIGIHENSLSVVECEFSIGRLDAALDGTRSIGSQLLKLQEQDPDNDRVVGALAHSFSLAGRILEGQEEIELAIEAYQQSADLYAHSVKLNAAIDAYQLGLGNSLARAGLLAKDKEKLEGAVEVLGRVVVHNPFESAYQKTLADVYGVLARDQRDGGQLENAIALEKEAISVLQPIVRESGFDTPPDVLYSYSLRLAHLAELLGDEGDFDESRKPLQEAITVLDRIANSAVSVAAYQRALARARGLAGFACLKSGDDTKAKEHLELAKAEWESYVQSNPEDVDAEQAVRWTDDQLRGLQ
tara:strand:+ start:672 stop:3503 length:2832 start_codon:yes stop_codon:yes gene_type:complete